MNTIRCKSENYYTRMDRAKVYIDYTNNRMKIVSIENISPQNIRRLVHFASKRHLDKIICNCNVKSYENFLKAGFKLEGIINGFFKGKDAFYMSFFISNSRQVSTNSAKENLILKKSLSMQNTFVSKPYNLKYTIRQANENDIKDIVKLFSYVFSTYPSPIFDEEYLKRIMNKNVLYKVAVYNNKIISICSANLDKENLNAKISDCATYPSYRGKGIMSNIIYSLESDLKDMGYMTLYSLSRAICPSINFIFSKHNYKFKGKLINNCNICGGFEDMNLWVKNINSHLPLNS
jgi:beta-lysine N6-acetyltransferase